MKRLILLYVLLLAGCHRIQEGQVIDKNLIPAHSESYAQITWIGKIPVTNWHTRAVPDKFSLIILGYDCEKHPVIETFEVSRAVYVKKNIGDWYNPVSPFKNTR